LYVAPELSARNAPLTPAVDVFSFGVVAYWMLTGRQPYLEAPLVARMGGRRIASVPPIASLRSEIPEPLARALDACLAAEPTHRPTVEALIALFAEEQAERGRARDSVEASE
jgi:serine/threonine-protein kinase